MSEKGWIRRHALETIIGTVIALVITAFLPPVQRFLVSVPGHVGRFFGWLGAPVETSRWWYWTMSVVVVLVGAVVLLALVAAVRSKGPSYFGYTSDTYFGLMWRWAWPPQGFVRAEDLTPYCPRCDRVLDYAIHREGIDPGTGRDRQVTTFICSACGDVGRYPGNVDEMQHAILGEIDLKKRKGTWNKPAGAAASTTHG